MPDKNNNNMIMNNEQHSAKLVLNEASISHHQKEMMKGNYSGHRQKYLSSIPIFFRGKDIFFL